MLRPAAVLLVVSFLLAGCAGKPSTSVADEAEDSGSQASMEVLKLDASSSVPAPTWAVGQWWEWEASFGDTVTDGTFCTIVTAVDATYEVATENEAMAKEAAA